MTRTWWSSSVGRSFYSPTRSRRRTCSIGHRNAPWSSQTNVFTTFTKKRSSVQSTWKISVVSQRQSHLVRCKNSPFTAPLLMTTDLPLYDETISLTCSSDCIWLKWRRIAPFSTLPIRISRTSPPLRRTWKRAHPSSLLKNYAPKVKTWKVWIHLIWASNQPRLARMSITLMRTRRLDRRT